MPRPISQGIITYQALAGLTGLPLNAVHQHAVRKNFDIENLESVVIWLSRHAKIELRRRILDYALLRELPERPGSQKKPRRTKKAPPKQDGKTSSDQ